MSVRKAGVIAIMVIMINIMIDQFCPLKHFSINFKTKTKSSNKFLATHSS